jgi:D-alanyl-D-alanine carboxypeptidase/D-alanyl-D-alanine-endopeptidase (penicillin-binding protein 4)
MEITSNMKMRIFFISITLLMQINGMANAADAISRVIDRNLLSKCISKESTSVRVVDVMTGRVVYDRKGEKPLVPASVQKVLTTAAALYKLGSNYRFKTTFLRTGPLVDGVIKGDLIIRGGGDPKLVVEKVWLISQRLSSLGINQVQGDLVVDNTFFDGRKTAPSWPGRHSQRPHDARLGALSVNFNTIGVTVSPGEKPGKKINAAILPKTEYVELVNNARTTGSGRNTVGAWRSQKGGKIRVSVTGTMRRRTKDKTIYLNVEDPAKYAGEVFRSYMEVAGVGINGEIKSGTTPEGAVKVMVHESEPLAVILRDLNKYSNNFVAEQVAKTMAAESNGSPGNHSDALNIVERFLNELGVNMAGVSLADASGLSRKNRVTAAMITDFLAKVYRRFDIGPDFVSALGIMGVDGSVKDRMKKSPAKSLSRVKTGSLYKISALAGYVSGSRGGLYSFAMFLNGVNCYYKDADRLEDEIVTAIHTHDPATP